MEKAPLGGFALTSGQLNFWLQEKLEPGHPAMVLVVHWRLSPATSEVIARVHRAFERLVERHSLLRTTFPQVEGVPRGKVGPPVLDFEEHSTSGGSVEERLAVDRARPFDLEREPPLRIRLYRGTDHLDLAVMIHHIAVDWFSLLILFADFRRLVAGKCLATSGADFAESARAQNAWLATREAQVQLSAWRQELAPPCPDFRLRPEHPEGDRTQTGQVQFHLNAAESGALRELAAQHQCSLLAVLLTAYAEVLARHEGLEEVIVVVPCTTRDRRLHQDLVGPLFNLLPLRLEVRGSFRRRLSQAGQRLSLALEREQFPFWDLVEELRPRSPQGHPPLTDASLSLLPGWDDWDRLEPEEVTIEELHQDFLVGPFGVTMNLIEEQGGLRGALQYDQTLLAPDTARRWTRQFVEVLQGSLIDPGSRAWPEPENHQRMEEWFSARVAEGPARPALIEGAQTLTYGELEDWSGRLASLLPAEVAGRPVGVLSAPGAESVAANLAVLKAGGICLPLDPELPPQRLGEYGRDSGCEWVFFSHKWRGPVPFGRGLPIEREPSGESGAGVYSGAGVEAAYLIYTSGSTGSPVGVLGSHRGVLRRAEWMGRVFPWSAEERCLLRTPPGFIDSVNEWFAPLTGGAALVPYRQGRLLDPDRLMLFLQKAGVNRMTVVPGILQLLLNSPHHWPGELRYCFSSGEVLRPDLVERFRRRAGPIPHLINLYGSTECSGDVTWCDTRFLEKGATTVPLGVPLGGNRIHLLDSHLRPVEAGEEGDVWVAGPALCLGYWQRPELECDSFRENPFGPGRLGRTGDRGRWRRGQLEFRGRCGGRGKVRGWRVELGEVEAALASTPGVLEGAADFREGCLKAWVVGDRDFTPERLWSHLLGRLPEPMVPSSIYRLLRLPRLASMKVDRAGLEGGKPLPRWNQESPEGPAQQPVLVSLWQRALEVPRVGLHDNFFELGGHSLQAVHLMELISQRFGVRLSPTVLLEAPTVATLGEKIGSPPLPEVLTTLRSQGSRPPLFLLPGAWGGPLSLKELVHRLPAEQPVYCFDFEGVGREDRASLSRLAQRYVAEVVERFPEGRLRLMGFSMGGTVAYEMARHLEDRIERLVLLDTRGPRFIPREGNLVLDKLSLAWHLFWVALRSPPRLTLTRLWRRLTGKAPRMTVSERYDLAARYAGAFQTPASPYAGPVTLLRLTHQPHYVGQRLLGWEGLFLDLSVRRLSGVHSGLLLEVPLVDGLARALEEAFET